MENNTTQEQTNHIKGVVETLLFIAENPVSLEQIRKVLETVGAAEIKAALKSLQDEYEERQSGMTIVEIAGGYQMLSNPNYVSYARQFYKTKHKEKLSKPALESLAIIAYKQPVTRADIEIIRGVNSDGVTSHLLQKELIKVVGRRDVAGRPFLYGTTKQFLEYFGLKSLDSLPKLEEFPALQERIEKGAEAIAAEQEGDAATQETTEGEQPAEQEQAPIETSDPVENNASEVESNEGGVATQTQTEVATQTQAETQPLEVSEESQPESDKVKESAQNFVEEVKKQENNNESN